MEVSGFQLHVPHDCPFTIFKEQVSPRHDSEEENLRHLFINLNVIICFTVCVGHFCDNFHTLIAVSSTHQNLKENTVIRNLREMKGRERKNGEMMKKRRKQEQNKRSNKLGYVHMPG